jgi:hypothetical protein
MEYTNIINILSCTDSFNYCKHVHFSVMNYISLPTSWMCPLWHIKFPILPQFHLLTLRAGSQSLLLKNSDHFLLLLCMHGVESLITVIYSFTLHICNIRTYTRSVYRAQL